MDILTACGVYLISLRRHKEIRWIITSLAQPAFASYPQPQLSPG